MKNRSSPDKKSGNPSDKHKDDKSDKRYPNPDDQNEETGPPIKEMQDKDTQNQEKTSD